MARYHFQLSKLGLGEVIKTQPIHRHCDGESIPQEKVSANVSEVPLFVIVRGCVVGRNGRDMGAYFTPSVCH